MNRHARFLYAIAVGLAIAFPSISALAGPVSGNLFYTRFSGAPNVKSVPFNFDGAATFTLGARSAVGTTNGADGIAGNPQNSDLLIVGGQGNRINTISKSTGATTQTASPESIFHLEVPNSTVVLGSGIPAGLARHAINPDGSLGPGTSIALSGSNTTLTQVITTPSGFFYTSSGSSGFGSFGTLSFNTGIPNTATSAVTNALITGLPAAHGGVYDPFTNSIMLFGDAHITQLSLSGGVLADITFSSLNFDQGTVDGAGHLFAASNTGHLTFIDYSSAGGLINGAGAFQSTLFLDSNLDDIAPLIGSGTTTPNDVPEPTTLGLFGVGLLGLSLIAKRRQTR